MLFISGWLVLGAVEGNGYSAGRHDISDLSALTAQHPWIDLATVGIAGALTMAFALLALRPALTLQERRTPICVWLVALSLPSLDGIGDVFFRLDCRAVDVGCSTSAAISSWHGKAHVIVFLIALVPTLAAPFALAHRMKLLPDWRDLARPARALGVLAFIGLGTSVPLQGTGAQGWSQRVLAALLSLGVAALAVRVLRLARSTPRTLTANPTIADPALRA